MDYNELLDLTLEIEGLIMLKLQRGESAPAETDELLRRKIDFMQKFVVGVEPVTPADDYAAIAESAAFEEASDADEDTAAQADTPAPADSPAQPLTVADTIVRDEPSVNEAIVSATGDVSKVFTLNDKFRFRRELFSNSNEEFTDTINVLQAMSSLDEAEDYLYNDLAWDPDNEDVKAFIGLIAPCYS